MKTFLLVAATVLSSTAVSAQSKDAVSDILARQAAMDAAKIPADKVVVEDVKWTAGPPDMFEPATSYDPCFQTMRGVLTNNSTKPLVYLQFSVRVTDCLADHSRCRVVGDEVGGPRELEVPAGQTRAFSVGFCFANLPPLDTQWHRTYSWQIREASACTRSWAC